MPLSEQDVRAILQVIDEAPLAELRIETDGFSLHVIKGPAVESAPVPAPGSAPAPAPASAPAPAPASAPASAPAPTAVPSPAATGAPAPETSAPPDPSELVTVTAPMVGVFYRAEGPGEAPFVAPGSEVEPDTTVCILEVMKMMNSVPAGVAGTVVEVCQENGAAVEEGAPLFRIRPR